MTNLSIEVVFVNALLKLLGISQDMDYFKAWLLSKYQSICKKHRFDAHNTIRLSIVFLELVFLGVYCAKFFVL